MPDGGYTATSMETAELLLHMLVPANQHEQEANINHDRPAEDNGYELHEEDLKTAIWRIGPK